MLPKKAKIVEVGPRDGLQNEKTILTTSDKVELIRRLSESGLKNIEATSFVSPKWVPQFADAKETLESVLGASFASGVDFPVLIPNLQGLERALEFDVKTIAVFTTVSETFSKKNTNCSVQESLDRIDAIFSRLQNEKVRVRGYISCVIACPYEGKMPPEKSAEIAKHLLAKGAYEISLGDTIGVGRPNEAQKLIETVSRAVPMERLAVHFHDTYGQALANIYAALQMGITVIDSSVGGLGGCPYAPGAGGNVATEDVLYMLDGLGIESGVNLKVLLEAAKFASDRLGRSCTSKVYQALCGRK